jgi:hypothetical protein
MRSSEDGIKELPEALLTLAPEWIADLDELDFTKEAIKFLPESLVHLDLGRAEHFYYGIDTRCKFSDLPPRLTKLSMERFNENEGAWMAELPRGLRSLEVRGFHEANYEAYHECYLSLPPHLTELSLPEWHMSPQDISILPATLTTLNLCCSFHSVESMWGAGCNLPNLTSLTILSQQQFQPASDFFKELPPSITHLSMNGIFANDDFAIENMRHLTRLRSLAVFPQTWSDRCLTLLPPSLTSLETHSLRISGVYAPKEVTITSLKQSFREAWIRRFGWESPNPGFAYLHINLSSSLPSHVVSIHIDTVIRCSALTLLINLRSLRALRFVYDDVSEPNPKDFPLPASLTHMELTYDTSLDDDVLQAIMPPNIQHFSSPQNGRISPAWKWPPSLTSLALCSDWCTLTHGPPPKHLTTSSLTHLELKYMDLDYLSALPATLKTLASGIPIGDTPLVFTALPRALERLVARANLNIQEEFVSHLPPTLKVLNLDGISFPLEAVPDLLPQLECLSCHNLVIRDLHKACSLLGPNVKAVKLPSDLLSMLRRLRPNLQLTGTAASGAISFAQLTQLPRNIVSIQFEVPISSTNLPNTSFPGHLQEILFAITQPGITDSILPLLPTGLISLALVGKDRFNPKIKLSPEAYKILPSGLQRLSIEMAPPFTAESASQLPKGLLSLHLSGCRVPSDAIPSLPRTITQLLLPSTTEIEDSVIPAFPPELRHLQLLSSRKQIKDFMEEVSQRGELTRTIWYD